MQAPLQHCPAVLQGEASFKQAISRTFEFADPSLSENERNDTLTGGANGAGVLD
jgi:hypothetical protein